VPASARIALRVAPGAAAAGVVGRHGDAWKVRVTPPAEGGRANEAVVRLLADTFSVPSRDVAVVAGHTSRDKIVAVAGVDLDQADALLARASAGRP
jgi:uncharacterized protein (TIGR00251 family)